MFCVTVKETKKNFKVTFKIDTLIEVVYILLNCDIFYFCL